MRYGRSTLGVCADAARATAGVAAGAELAALAVRRCGSAATVAAREARLTLKARDATRASRRLVRRRAHARRALQSVTGLAANGIAAGLPFADEAERGAHAADT